jgi:hypothetical protein
MRVNKDNAKDLGVLNIASAPLFTIAFAVDAQQQVEEWWSCRSPMWTGEDQSRCGGAYVGQGRGRPGISIGPAAALTVSRRRP